MIAWRDIRIKYKQSIMGIMWAVFMPMIIVGAGVLVRYGLALVSNKAMDISDMGTVAVRAVPWAFFISSIRFSTSSLVANSSLITKIYFPRIVFPIGAIISQLFDFIVAACLLILILSIMRIGISIHLLWVPALVVILVVFTSGLGIFLSAVNLFYRDIKYLVEVILTFAIFFTPVFFDVSMFGKWANVLMLNPVAPILEGFSACIVYQHGPSILWISYSVAVSFGVFVFAWLVFRKLEPLFAERI
jgi:lipopolysaccharide transport system permease protein